MSMGMRSTDRSVLADTEANVRWLPVAKGAAGKRQSERAAAANGQRAQQSVSRQRAAALDGSGCTEDTTARQAHNLQAQPVQHPKGRCQGLYNPLSAFRTRLQVCQQVHELLLLLLQSLQAYNTTKGDASG